MMSIRNNLLTFFFLFFLFANQGAFEWASMTSLINATDIIKDNNLDHSSKTNKKTQWDILNFMIEEQQKYRASQDVIFDRCPLDNLVYSMWSEEKKNSDIDEKFIKKCIPLVRESLRFIDIILQLAQPVHKSLVYYFYNIYLNLRGCT